MSPNKNKQKGTRWENELVELLNKNIPGADARRVAGSGALGTTLNEPLLQADIVVKFPGVNKKFRIEAKCGYGGAKQLTVKREWLNKVKGEAENSYAYPALAGKFMDARKADGVKYFVIMDLDSFCDIIRYMGNLPVRDE